MVPMVSAVDPDETNVQAVRVSVDWMASVLLNLSSQARSLVRSLAKKMDSSKRCLFS